ncbi:NAD(P)-dependent oxidoreductase [Nitrosopumilus sp.]|uniref:NAD-dependent epimerase/dehydratase family protein n=1 Tax=Nitrosopumilus sp. TaxID=2024843 RepID=UPI00262CD480|nr:SDR family oxidoreductase [Nitrosopumilus sp.]
MNFSIIGPNSFIGTHMASYLRDQNIEYEFIDPNDEKIFQKKLGHVIFAIGLTGDFRNRPFDTVESHVCVLKKILEKCKFDSFLYLSSTRIYLNSDSTIESKPIVVNPHNLDDLYNISKIMGESLCLASNSRNIKVVRLSNVIGKKNSQNDFLSSIIHDAVINKKIILHTTPESEKDYLYIDDVVQILEKIAIQGKERLYNVAYGENTKVSEISTKIQKITNCELDYDANAVNYSFPRINIKRIKDEFDFNPSPFLDKLDELINYEIKNNN